MNAAENEEFNRTIEKIESMISVLSLESTLTGLMLKELFYGNDAMKEKYEKFRVSAHNITRERFGESSEKFNVKELETGNSEKLTGAEEQRDEDRDAEQESGTELRYKFEKLLYRNLAEIKSKLSDTRHDLSECVTLLKWYEDRDENIMNILKNRTGGNIQENDDELIGYFLNTQGERPSLNLKSVSGGAI